MNRELPSLVALGTAVSLLLVGCGSIESEEPEGPVDLRMTVWSTNEDHLALFDEVAAAYIEDHPDEVASVTFESIPSADYTAALRTQIAGDNPPDLAWILEANAPEFIQSGALVDLSATFESTPDYDLDDILEAPLELWRDGDGLYAYPFSSSPMATFVNLDLLEEAGQPSPEELESEGRWTWDSAREMAAAVASETDATGLVVRDFEYRQWNRLAEIWSSWGAAPWSADGTQCTFDSPEMVEAMTWIHDTIFVDEAMPAPGTSADFFAGESAMTLTQISRASALDGSFEWDVFPLPEGPQGQVNVIGQAGVGALAGGDTPEIAADFLAHFTNRENAAQLGQFFPSPRESSLNAETLAAANPLMSEEQLQAVVVDAVDGAVTLPSHRNAGEIMERARVLLDEMWVPDASVEAVLQDVCAGLDPLLAG